MATTFPLTKLPAELQRNCINFLDVQTLKDTRLVNRAVKDVATEALFQIIALWPTDESAEKFEHVAQSEELNPCIRKVILNTDEDPERRPWYDGSDFDDSEKEILKSWAGAVQRVPEFSNIRHLELKFAVECNNPSGGMTSEGKRVPETLSFRTQVLNNVFEILNKSSAVNVDTLSIKHLQDVTRGVYSTPAFQVIRNRITKLHLQIALEQNDFVPEESIEITDRHEFFNHEFNTIWLTPMQTQLTHLTLYCNDFWGLYPRWDPRDLQFPHLKSLSLGNYSIVFDWQIEWILSLGSSLEELSLDNCPIVHAVRMTQKQFDNRYRRPGERRPGTSRRPPPQQIFLPDMRWHTVFPLFSASLTKLKRFAMGHGEWEFEDGLEDDRRAFEHRGELKAQVDDSRYCYFDFGAGSSPWIEYDRERGQMRHERTWTVKDEGGGERKVELMYPDCLEEDERALNELLMGLGRKSGTL